MNLGRSRLRVCVAAALVVLPTLAPALGGRGKKSSQEPRPLAIQLGAPFHDHAILQRGTKVPVWGWSKAGTELTVTFAGQTKSTTAGKDGNPSSPKGSAGASPSSPLGFAAVKWTIWLDPLEASSEPREMVIAEKGGKTEILKDILVGEVWLASGQSNMQWPAAKTDVGRVLQKGIHTRVKAGAERMPQIREVKIPGFASSLIPQEKAKAQWSKDWRSFSAIAFAFAYEVQRELQVPVGIVNCTFSSTPIQAWAHRDGFRDGKDEFTQAVHQRILEADQNAPEHETAWQRYYEELRSWARECGESIAKGRPIPSQPPAPGNLRGSRDATWLYNSKTHPMAPYAIKGVIWNQGYHNSGDGIVYRNYLHSLVRSFRAVWDEPDLPVYFHQFYSLGSDWDGITLNSYAEMRLGTWLAHGDIPNAAMASQIDITGSVHYGNKTVPGQRLALHALKNQYGKDIIANGPMYRSYTVRGDTLILELDHAQGLKVGRSGSGGIAAPIPVEHGEDQVTLFYLAGRDLKWHRARVKILGEAIELTAPGLREPCGVAYGCNGVGRLPNIYNEAMLPLTPFIYFDHKLVVSDQWELAHIMMPDHPIEMMTWPMEYIPLADREVDPTTYGIMCKYRRLPLLSPQFRDGGVIQAGVPTRIYGAAVPGSVVRVVFAGMERTVRVGSNESEWEATFDALPATEKPTTIHATCTLDGTLAHERTIGNIVIGDLWYVSVNNASMPEIARYPRYDAPTGPVRMFQTATKKTSNPMPDRFKLTVTGTVKSRFYAKWAPPQGLAKELGDRINAATGKPVGVIVMNTQGDVPVKGMVGYRWLEQVPAWKDDFDQLRRKYSVDPEAHAEYVELLIKGWQDYWMRYLTDPTFSKSRESGGVPRLRGAARVNTPATTRYNLVVAPYGPANFKGVICFTPKSFMGDNEGASFGNEFQVMVNCWKDTFAYGKRVLDPHFVYTVPTRSLAQRLTVPSGIKGMSTAVEMAQWPELVKRGRKRVPIIGDDIKAVLDAAVKAVYK